MPVYCFRCPSCGQTKEVLRSIAERNRPVECKRCFRFVDGEADWRWMNRDLQAETLGSSDLPYAVPVLSDAMGMSPHQIPEFKKLHPHIEVTGEGQVVSRSHREHKRNMKELGFYDRNGYC